MPSLKEKAITLLASVAALDMSTAGSPKTLFTVPAGKTCRITHVVVRDNSASLAAGTSYSITNWRQTFSLATLTGTGAGYVVIQSTDLTLYTETAAGVAVTLTVTTGATATATIDIFGYLT